MTRLILASKSPRRRELLSMLDIPFQLAEEYPCNETYPSNLPAEKVPEYLSRLKSDAYPYPLEAGDVVITADTVVICGGDVLGKPQDSEDAVKMLQKLSGKKHSVVTGVTLKSKALVHTFSDVSYVTFRTMTETEIRYYVERYSPLDKAGAYGIQEWIGVAAISSINGSYYNIVGLPTEKLFTALASNHLL